MNMWNYISDYRFKVFNKHWWHNFWYEQVSTRIRPRNAWLTSKIPRTWIDKDTIMETVLLESLKHYCEESGENCFNTLSCDNPPEQAKFMQEARNNYELVTQKLVSLQKELNAEWDAVPDQSLDDINNNPVDKYERLYGKIDRLDKEIYDLQTQIMTWMVIHRNELWT